MTQKKKKCGEATKTVKTNGELQHLHDSLIGKIHDKNLIRYGHFETAVGRI